MSFKIVVLVDGSGRYYDHSPRFETWGEANIYAIKLKERRPSVTKVLLLTSDDPVSHAVRSGELISFAGQKA